MKKMKKFVAMMFVLIMCTALSVPCFAAETILADGTVILGTAEDDEGYPGYFGDEEIAVPQASNNLRFSFRAEEVYDLLTTRYATGKTVTLWNESYDYRVQGQPHFTPRPTTTSYCRAGLCYYDSGSGTFKTNTNWYSNYFSDETGGTKYIDRTSMTAELTYYGFCKNLLNEDGGEDYAMSGTFYVYNVNIY